jgi:protocatechuate 3,4-dioxygenase beta subunit
MLKSFTSDDGSFVLENVPTGNMQVVANASGYTTGRVPSVVIEEGKTTSDIEVALETGAKLTGRVTGPDGAALSGVNVRQGGDQMRMMMGTDASAVTDANGDYTIDSLEQGEKTFVFGRGGYLNETKTVNIASKETRLDVQLSTGLRVTGQVVTEAGVPVGDASVRASSASASGFGKGTRTDSSGNFTLEGVAPGHYTFTASKDGYADAISRDVDVSSGASIRLALKTGGVVFGHITGVPAEDLSRVTVNIRSTSGGGSEATVDPSGNFRLEGAPTGTLRVSAEMMRGFTDRRTTEVRIVELAPGGSVQADLEFNTQTVIRGRVTRNGAAVGSAGVMFMPMPGSTTATTARTTTDDAGNYTVSGLGDARYNVTVVESRLNPYNTSYEVHGSSNFDIDIKAASLRGRVIDSATNDPIADAVVQLRKKADMSDMAMFASRTATTDANGVFVMEAISAGTYVASAEKQGWGSSKNDVVVGDSAPQDVELRLAKNDGVLLKVVDGRDGRTLAAQAVALDASGQIAYDSPMFGGGTEPLRLSLAPGQYRVIVAAQGYAAQSVTVTSPSQPTIALTPGGTVVVHSSATSSLRARLVNSSGIVYARPYNRDGIFMVAGENTSVFNVQPGRYKLQILEGGAVVKTMDVVVTEGGTVSADI